MTLVGSDRVALGTALAGRAEAIGTEVASLFPGFLCREAFASALPDDRVRLRYFDAEAFSGKCTDVAMFETEDLQAYYFAVERLRDTPLFSHPYFEVVKIIPAMEDGFRAFEASEAA